jgi:hypothetical protein
MDRIDLFKKLYQRCSDYIELRAILGRELRGKEFVDLKTDWQTTREQVDKFCQKYKDVNIYFGIATRDGKGGKKKNIKSIPCVWAEMDYKHYPEEPEARVQKIIDKLPFKPTIIIKSGGGVYLIFLLDKPVGLERSADVVKVNEWIRLELNKLGKCEFDKISEIPRILRLPGTANHKYDHKPICEVVEINDNAYKLDDLLKNIPESDTKQAKRDETYKSSARSTSKTGAELEAQVEYVVKQFEEKKPDMSKYKYNDMLNVGFALTDGLGEVGRTYFHRIIICSNDYDKDDCDRQYDACLNGSKPDDRITIATFFFMQRRLA